MTIRYAAIGAGAVLAAIALQGTSAQALTMTECSAKYKAAKDAGSLNGMKWNDFRKAQCGSDAGAAPTTAVCAGSRPGTGAPSRSRPPPAPAATGNAVFPSAVDSKYSKEFAGQGPHGDLPRSVQGQQDQQRQRRPEVDPEGRRLLQRMQQAPEGRGLT